MTQGPSITFGSLLLTPSLLQGSRDALRARGASWEQGEPAGSFLRPIVVETLKPSITFHSLGSLQLAPAHSQLTPQFTPAHSSSPVCSSLLPPCPIAPYTPQVVGTPTHTWPLGASWSKLGASWNELGAGSELEQAWSKLE